MTDAITMSLQPVSDGFRAEVTGRVAAGNGTLHLRVTVERPTLEALGPAFRKRLQHEAKDTGYDPGDIVRAFAALGLA